MSTTVDAIPDWPRRAAALADELVGLGKLSPAWRPAVEATPRHLFVPEFYERDRDAGAWVDGTDPGYPDQLYANRALITKLDTTSEQAGNLSSCSTPGLVTRMLEALDLHPGHRVLEIGTGTGYNVALICHRLGAAGVVSIDVEPDLVELARARLATLGYAPTLLAGDGAAGAAEHGPFDRIVATCSVHVVPWSWMEQTRIGGHILTDLRPRFTAGNLVRLTRTAEDRAEGMFDAGQATFMALRHQPGRYEPAVRRPVVDRDRTVDSRTSVDPTTPWSNPVAWLLAVLNLDGDPTVGYGGHDPQRELEWVSITGADGSRAEIALRPGGDGRHAVTESGPDRLWAHVERAHRLWSEHGSPGWARLGLTVTPDRQTLFVDSPDRPVATLC